MRNGLLERVGGPGVWPGQTGEGTPSPLGSPGPFFSTREHTSLQPKTLSASSIQAYESCPARYAAGLTGAQGLSGAPAEIGTVCHEVLRRWVQECHHTPAGQWPMMERLYGQEYVKLFGDDGSRFDDGLTMLTRWFDRNDLAQKTILTTELKEQFTLFLGPRDTPTHAVPVTYIWDRCDQIRTASGGFEIQVYDYKTISQPFPPERLRNKIQARIYSLAARLKYPEAERIWVVFDLLRYDEVGTVFTKDEDVATWRYLQSVYERVLADDGTTEKLNSECRWCIRKLACEKLTKHSAIGGPLGITDPIEAADRRAELHAAKVALDAGIDELDQVILQHCEREEILDFTTDRHEVKITAKRTRDVDTTTVVQIVGEEIAAEYGKIGVTAVDRILRDPRLTADQRGLLKQAFTTRFSEPFVKVTPVSVMGEDEDAA